MHDPLYCYFFSAICLTLGSLFRLSLPPIHSPSEEFSSAFSTLMASTFIRLGKSKLALWISALSLHQRWTGSIERARTLFYNLMSMQYCSCSPSRCLLLQLILVISYNTLSTTGCLNDTANSLPKRVSSQTAPSTSFNPLLEAVLPFPSSAAELMPLAFKLCLTPYCPLVHKTHLAR